MAKGKSEKEEKPRKKKRKAQPVLSERELARRKRLEDITANVEDENEHEKNVLAKIFYPITKCNSLPIIHEEAIYKSIFWDDSKSGDYGFEPNPDIPGTVVVLDDYPIDKLESLKDLKYSDSPRSTLSFLDNNGDDSTEQDLLDKVKDKDASDFIKTRVGKKNLDAIIDHFNTIESSDEEKENLIKSTAKIKSEIKQIESSRSVISTKRKKRPIWIILILILAIIITGVGVAIYLLNVGNAKPPPPPPPSLPPVVNGMPEFEYLPPGKVLTGGGSILNIPLQCGVKVGSYKWIGNLIIEDLLLSAFRLAGLSIKSADVKDRVLLFFNNTMQGTGVVRLNFYGSLPVFLWYGMDFLDETFPLERQLYVFMRDVIMVNMGNEHPAVCTCTSYRINAGNLKLIQSVGAIFQEFTNEATPLEANMSQKGFIRREYEKMVWPL